MVIAPITPAVPPTASSTVSPEQWRTIVNRLTRRQFGLAGAAVLALTACGPAAEDGGAGDEDTCGCEVEDAMGFVTDDIDLDDELISGVPAVAAGNAYSIDDRVWIAGIGVIGAERIISDAREFLG